MPKFEQILWERFGNILKRSFKNHKTVKKHASPASSPGLFPQKMGGAGKGPGIGWSRVQPKYS